MAGGNDRDGETQAGPGADGTQPERRDSLLPDDHWSRNRSERNHEALEYLREKSRAPGVAEGGAERNQYCMQCGGVLPLAYVSSQPADRAHPATCPHCGAEVHPTVRAMFNWVEIDQVPRGDFAALAPWLFGAVLLVGAALAFWLFV
jgi:hypothetical protein